MTDIINLILIVIGFTVVSRIVYMLLKRLSLLIKLASLKKTCGAKITYKRSPFLPMRFSSEKPDITVEILDTVYLIRLYSGGNATKFVHFADPNYSVIFSRLNVGRFTSSSRIANRLITLADSAMNMDMRVVIVPDFPIPEDESFFGKRVERVYLFNPAPSEVTFVTEETTSIRTAFDGDEMYGIKIFSLSGFIAHADRETRKNDELMYF